MPVWRDTSGRVYDSWEDLSVDHLKNVVVLLAKRAEEAQKEFNKYRDVKDDSLTYKYLAEERWRGLLITLEEASRNLKSRIESGDQWALDPAPKTAEEAIKYAVERIWDAREGKLLVVKRARTANKAVNTISAGKIEERPRKLRMRGNDNDLPSK